MLMGLGRGVDKLFNFLFVLVLSEWLWQGVASRFPSHHESSLMRVTLVTGS
jgi:hypothetical protein